MTPGNKPRIEGLQCFDCHNVLNVDRDSDIRFNHQKHEERGVHCVACHGTYDHNPKPQGSQPHEHGVGQACLGCHDGKQADDDCMVCHRDRSILMPKSHKRPGFVRSHGPVNDPNTDCHLCHAASWCLNCHQLPVPHPVGFMPQHGALAQKNPKLCYQCHEPQGCDNCHGSPVPHTEPFLEHHGRYDLATCGKCHDEQFCHTCHKSQDPHPQDFVKTHGQKAGLHPEGCHVCHDRSWCQGCHGLPLPHPGNYIQTHGPIALRSRDVCMRCHKQTQCDSCHGLSMPHAKGFLKQHSTVAKQRPAACIQCHTESECRQCHGTQVPHPSDYVISGHKGEAKGFGSDQFCFKCHTQAQCAMCHVKE